MAKTSLPENVFNCLRCGKCCQHPDSVDGSQRYIPVYLDEIEHLQVLAKERNVSLELEEDVMYPDFLNQRLILISYALKFSEACPFFNEGGGCTIYKDRPLTCRAFPVSIWREDGFKTLMHVEAECSFIASCAEKIAAQSFERLKKFFPNEFERAKELMIKGKNILYKIIELEMAKIVDIGFLSRKLNFFFCLENEKPEFLEWPRIKLSDLKLGD